MYVGVDLPPHVGPRTCWINICHLHDVNLRTTGSYKGPRKGDVVRSGFVVVSHSKHLCVKGLGQDMVFYDDSMMFNRAILQFSHHGVSDCQLIGIRVTVKRCDYYNNLVVPD